MEDMLRRQTSNSQDVGTFQDMAKWSRVHLTDRRKTVNVDLSAVADSRISRRVFVRRKSAEKNYV